jgi:hypothetical protein
MTNQRSIHIIEIQYGEEAIEDVIERLSYYENN